MNYDGERQKTLRVSIVKFALLLNLVRPYSGVIPFDLSLQIGGRLIDLVVVLLCAAALFSRRNIRIPRAHSLVVVGFPLVHSVVALALIIFGMIYYGHSVTVRDLFEPFRYIIMLVVFLAAYNALDLSDQRFWDRFWRFAIIFFAIIVAIRISQFSAPNFLVDVFYGASKDKFVSSSFVMRQTGFFINPNWAGVFLSWALAYFLFAVNKKSVSSFAFVFLTLLLVVTTGSRTALICSFVVISFWLLTKAQLIHWIMLAVLAVIGVMFVGIEDVYTVLPAHYRELLRVLIETGSIREVGTLNDRLDIWQNAIERHFYASPLFGHGPFKGAVVDVADNQYVKWVLWYGLFGVLLITAYHAYFGIVGLAAVLNRNVVANKPFANSIIAMLISLAVASITGAFFDVTQLSIILFMMFGGMISMLGKPVEHSVETNTGRMRNGRGFRGYASCD